MTGKIINLEQIRALKDVGIEWGPGSLFDDLPPIQGMMGEDIKSKTFTVWINS